MWNLKGYFSNSFHFTTWHVYHSCDTGVMLSRSKNWTDAVSPLLTEDWISCLKSCDDCQMIIWFCNCLIRPLRFMSRFLVWFPVLKMSSDFDCSLGSLGHPVIDELNKNVLYGSRVARWNHFINLYVVYILVTFCVISSEQTEVKEEAQERSIV